MSPGGSTGSYEWPVVEDDWEPGLHVTDADGYTAESLIWQQYDEGTIVTELGGKQDRPWKKYK